jgi:hypothetical protein
MNARDLFRNRTIRSVAVIYALFVVILLGTSLSSGDGLPEEFPAVAFALPDVFGGEDVVFSADAGQPVVIYFFASW